MKRKVSPFMSGDTCLSTVVRGHLSAQISAVPNGVPHDHVKRAPRRGPQGGPMNEAAEIARRRIGSYGDALGSFDPMEFPRRPYAVPRDAPVVVHRHGEGARRRSIAVIVDEGPWASDEDFDRALAVWRRRIGGWVTKAEAAAQLGVSTKRVDQLREQGKLKSRRVGFAVAIDLASLQDELDARSDSER